MLDFSNPKTSYIMNKYVSDLIEEKLKSLPFNRSVRAVVVSVGSGVATVKLLDSDQQIPNIKVRDGLSLSPDDNVYLTLINGSLNNMFVDLKIS